MIRVLHRTAFGLLLALSTGVGAQTEGLSVYYESEPNESPESANRIESGTRVVGEMTAGDQDGFLWEVSDVDALKRWTIELVGIPGALTIVELVRLLHTEDDRTLVDREKLLKLGSRDGTRPGRAANLLVEPGEYLLGVARSGRSEGYRPGLDTTRFTGDELGGSASTSTEPETETGYRLILREEADLESGSGTAENDTRERAIELRPGRERAAFIESDEAWFTFVVPEKEAGAVWALRAQVPLGNTASLELEDASGKRLKRVTGDRLGKMHAIDLSLAAGRYFAKLVGRERTLRTILFERTGAHVEGREAEPNDTFELANQVGAQNAWGGRFQQRGDEDHYRFEVDDARADQALVISIVTDPPGRKFRACLLDDRGSRLQCRDASGSAMLGSLVLSPGEYGLSLGRGDKGTDYDIRLEAEGPHREGFEAEPNDAIELATAFPARGRIRGALDNGDEDVFRLVVTGEPQLWRFQVIGEGVHEVAYHDGSGKRQQTARARGKQRRVRLDNLFLLPGTHYVAVSGKAEGDYTLLARPLGPPNENAEREPNDDASHMQRLAIGQTRAGTLPDDSDVDLYRFFLANHDHVRLTIEPPADGIAHASLSWFGEKLGTARPRKRGEPVSIAGVFPPGDYQVELRSRKASEAEYRIGLERLPRFSCPSDCEPNGLGEFHAAAPLPLDLVLEGRAGDWDDTDVYELPELENPSPLVIRSERKVRALGFGTSERDARKLEFDKNSGAYRVDVPAGDPHYLIVDTRGNDYRLELEFGPEAGIEPVMAPLAVSLALHLDEEAIAAYRRYGQTVSGRLKITNDGDEALDLAIDMTTSDHRWRVRAEHRRVRVGSGDEETVAVEILAPSDAWAKRPVRVSARVRDARGAQREVGRDVAVGGDMAPVEQTLYWPIPKALRGGFNLAWIPLGAEWTELPSDIKEPNRIRDNMVYDGRRAYCCGSNKGWTDDDQPRFTLDLPGDRPVPIAGMALNHFGSPGMLGNVREATLSLSEDGKTYREVLHVETLPVNTEQYFAMNEPVEARYAQLRVDKTFNASAGRRGLTLGEWKLIAKPGFDPSGGAGFNLADPDLGGHLVYDLPAEFYKPSQVLDADQQGNRAAARSDEIQNYVVGFHHNRAARINRIEWFYDDEVSAKNRFERIRLAVSIDSPVGPWKALGEFDIDDARRGSSLELESAVWARYVKLSAAGKGNSSPPSEPSVIRVWEQPGSDNYPSILAEWGQANRMAAYEAAAGVPPRADAITSDNDSRDEAATLEPSQPATGQVALGETEHWYRIEVPAGSNLLTTSVRGAPTVRTVLELEDHAGEPVPMRRTKDSDSRRHVFESIVESGAELYLRVYEPPRNVVFSWDTSASINAFLPTIYNSLTAFSSEVVPGREAVNLVPFGRKRPLLRDWYGEPYVLQTILNEYPRSESSSAAEKTLKHAARALAPLAGTKSIVVITDAITTDHGAMWREMKSIRPRIFGVHVGGAEAWNQDRFQDWTDVNGGHYTQLSYQGELEIAFDRAAHLMRRPAGYTVDIETGFQEAPGPGRLQVVSETAEDNTGPTGAVALILDASGSMLKRMDGEFRIDIARRVLKQALTEHLKPGTRVALRVFGHVEPNSCRTDLELPLRPLNAESATQRLDAIRVQDYSRTPIADSLAKVESDLAGAEGARTVVLVTDGEETCGGDPEDVIRQLKDRGFDIFLNIIGFAIDDTELADTFESWASLGGGGYFPADDAEGLQQALSDALRIPYTIFDASEEPVAEGFVNGEPVDLPAGRYRVVLEGGISAEYEDVRVSSDDMTTIELGG